MHEEPSKQTAADDRDEFGRPKQALAIGQLLAVTAYWLAITVLWGAFTFSVIPRLVESPGVLGSSTHPLAGLAIGLITTAGVLIAILVQPTMGAISDHTRSRLGRRKPYILIGTFLDLLFLTFAAWAFWNESYWAFVAAVALLQFSSNFAQGPYQGYIPDLVPGRQVGRDWQSSSWRSCPEYLAFQRSHWACSRPSAGWS
ncbi:MAG: MFS transporter [Chloroflexota bacterium]